MFRRTPSRPLRPTVGNTVDLTTRFSDVTLLIYVSEFFHFPGCMSRDVPHSVLSGKGPTSYLAKGCMKHF